MNIKKISKEAQTLISASAYINNFTRTIEELQSHKPNTNLKQFRSSNIHIYLSQIYFLCLIKVYNSLDAECTSIAIRVSIQESFIQILDNGIGINKENFCLLGQKYTTSKHIDVTTLKSAPDKYGFRGLSLASIIEISQDVLISSRYYESDETWLKRFHNGTQKEVCIAPARPSKGTTVEIRGFLYNLNIQRKSINNVHELQNIKTSLEQLSLIHCNVSISLRDDYNNEIIFKIHKKRDIYQTIWSLFEINREDIQELQVEKNQYKVKAFISKGNAIKQNQWIYLNGKFVSKTEIHKKVNKILNKLLFKHNKITKIKNKNNEEYCKNYLPFYFIFISCPFYDFDIIYKNKQTLVEFKDWTEIDKLIEKLIQFYCGESCLKETVEEKKIKIADTRIQVKQMIEKILNKNVKQSRISSVQHGIKGKNIKRKNKKKHKQIDNDISLKSQKPKYNLKVLNLKDKQEVKNDILNIKEKYDTKKQPMKPSFKDINKKYIKKTTTKQMKKIENLDCLINRFKNQTESVKKRCAKLSSEAQNIMNVAPQNKILKFTYTAEYNETISYGKEVGLDTYFVTTKTKCPENNFRNNNFDAIKPKTSYDLIKPFNQNDECLTIPEHTELQCTQSSPHPDSYKSLYPKNTFDSHNYQYNSEWKKNMKHFISTNSRHNFCLRNNNFTISHENLHRTKKSLFNEIYVRNNVNKKQVSYRIIDNKCDQKIEVNNTYIHNYEDCDNHLDTIINISDLRDNQSLIKSDFGITCDIKECSVENENAQNETYSVHLPNSISEYSSIKLSSVEKEFLIEQNIEHVQRNTKSTIIAESPSNIKYLLSESIDPLSYCEIIIQSNEMDDVTKKIINSITNNREKNDSFDYELLNDGNNEILETNLLKNTKDKEYGLKDMNFGLSNTELNIVRQNNFSHDVNYFQLKKRHEFMPKGLSQIYKARIRKNYDVSRTKIDYYENTVYNNFADAVLVNSEIFSPTLQNVVVNSRKFKKTNHRDDCNLKFNASSLKEAKVFGQIDRKFIATQIKGISSDSSLDFLVLFDQHAVDERIRLETNLADYFDGNIWSSVELDSIPLKLDKNSLLYLYNHKLKFNQFGLQWAFLDDEILVHSIPKAILGKNPRQEDVVLKAVRRLILEEIDVIKSLGGNITLYPKAIMDLVFSEACRYAIKFGDKLSKSDCVAMLKMLSTCKTPFQCAHGRPVMAVLIDLPRNIRSYEVNVDTIKRFKIRKSI